MVSSIETAESSHDKRLYYHLIRLAALHLCVTQSQ